uniref:UBP-type domain-containing protein n=1 Tax=Nelumbo nucifera TaxID=4432 RepID=A0A822ZLA8_NELNU|nr:TPA_asm: hypothetical protein HUJ06_016791 [Nelumbo nucifera]
MILCGRRNWDGSGGNNHAIEHYKETNYPLAVKLGTITADLEGAGGSSSCTEKKSPSKSENLHVEVLMGRAVNQRQVFFVAATRRINLLLKQTKETFEHLFFTWPYARAIWLQNLSGLNPDKIKEKPPHEIILNWLRARKFTVFCTVSITLYLIWKARNNLMFKIILMSPLELLNSLRSYQLDTSMQNNNTCIAAP